MISKKLWRDRVDIKELEKQLKEAEEKGWEIARLLRRKINELRRGQYED